MYVAMTREGIHADDLHHCDMVTHNCFTHSLKSQLLGYARSFGKIYRRTNTTYIALSISKLKWQWEAIKLAESATVGGKRFRTGPSKFDGSSPLIVAFYGRGLMSSCRRQMAEIMMT